MEDFSSWLGRLSTPRELMIMMSEMMVRLRVKVKDLGPNHMMSTMLVRVFMLCRLVIMVERDDDARGGDF